MVMQGKPLVVMSLEGLSQLLTIMCSKGVDQLCHFLSSLDDVMRDSDQQAIIHHCIRHFQVCCSVGNILRIVVDHNVICTDQNCYHIHAMFQGMQLKPLIQSRYGFLSEKRNIYLANYVLEN